MKQQLTDKQKLEQKQRNNLKALCNSVMSAWCFRELKSWDDVYKKLGISKGEKNGELKLEDLQAFLQSMKDELERKINNESSNISRIEDTSVQEIKEQTIQSSETKTIHNPKVKVILPKKEELSAKDNYGLIPCIKEKAFLFWFQKKACAELWHKIVIEGKSGVLLLAGTGTGKTYIIGALHARLLEHHFEEDKTFSHIPYLYITRTTVVEQAKRVFDHSFGSLDTVDIEIINIEQLRSKSGKMWLKEEVRIVNGEEESEWIWKKNVNPVVIYFDESQAAKNSTSKQHKAMCAYSNIEKNATLVNISATPFTRVSEAKCFAISTHRPLEHLGFPAGAILTEENWPTYASIIASDNGRSEAKPEDYNEAAIERLMKDLEEYVVRVKGVKPQFEAHNKVLKIDFLTKEEYNFYQQAWFRFQEEMAKLEKDVDGANYRFVILLKFAMAAELCRAKLLAKRMYEKVQNGKAAVCACKFKGTIIAVVQELNEKYGVSRDDISLIWGGGQTQLTKKQKAKKKIKSLADTFAAQGIDTDELLKDVQLDEVEDRELLNLPEHLRLGQQDMDERQVEIDKFQSGKSLYALFTFRASGVGLSLHHTDEMTEFKCRRKESGYAVEEDIPLVPVCPRDIDLSPTYSAIELVQGLGRGPRLTSLSNTEQTLLFYRGTIEEDIADIVSQKLRCLSKVVKMRESWSDVIVGEASKEDKLNTTKDVPPDEEGTQIESEEE